MKITLQPSDPLSQVVFVHDYLQLVFQEETFTIYNEAEVQTGSESYRTGQPGFRGALVEAIGQRITSASTSNEGKLNLIFEAGLRFSVNTDPASVGSPEAWQFSSPRQLPVAQQNV